GLQLAPAGKIDLHLDAFEQLQNQKPTNVQNFDLDFAIYQLDPAPPVASAAPSTISVDDYADQVRGFYHPEQIDAITLAWTNGDALLRLPLARSDTPITVTIQLAGGKRPAQLGAAQVCLSIHPETSYWVQDPSIVFAPLGCFDLGETMTGYTVG